MEIDIETELKDYIDERGYMEWYNFAPRDNVIVVRMIIQKLTTQTESGIYVGTAESKETVAPNYGEVVSQGPEVKEDLVGKVVFFPPQNMMPMAMLRAGEDGACYQMTTSDRLDGILVKDIRK